MFPFEIANVDSKGHCLNPRKVYLPHVNKVKEWVTKVAKVKLEERLVVALNSDLHSPLTMAAAQIKSTEYEANNEKRIALNDKRIDMLKFLLSHLKQEQWVYGPVRCTLLTLDGVEIRYDRGLYEGIDNSRTTLVDVFKRLFVSVVSWFVWLGQWFKELLVSGCQNTTEDSKDKTMPNRYNRIFSAIEWLCLSDADRAVVIPEIQKIIQMKWERFGYPKFLLSLVIHGFVCVLITLVLLFVNSTPASHPSVGSEYAANLLYAILVLVFLWMFIMEMHYIYYHPYSYLNTKGVVKFSRICLWAKIVSFAVFCILKTRQSYRGFMNDYYASNGPIGTESNPLGTAQISLIYQGISQIFVPSVIAGSIPTDKYNTQNFAGIKICLSVCVLFSWMHMYYFLMGFDKTGPFILTIFRIVSKDVPYFLKFYSIVVVAFACVLSMLSNNGDYHAYHGIDVLIQAVYTLIQNTVNEETTHNNITPNYVPLNLSWLSDIVLTGYYCVVVLIMLNLLIAMINHTYDRYTEYNESLLLMEKYNIMHSFELAMTREEMKTYRSKFAIIQSTEDDKEDKSYAEVDEENEKIPLTTSIKSQLSSILGFTSRNDAEIDALNGEIVKPPVQRPPVDRYTFEIQDEIDEWWDESTKSGETKSVMVQQAASSSLQPERDSAGGKSRGTSSTASLSAPVTVRMMPGDEDVMSTLLIIDPQCDFHPEGGPLNAEGNFDKTSPLYHKNGSLAVPGANEDSERVANMIKRNMHNIREIIVTMDSHYPTHIAHAIFWTDEKGNEPEVLTKIYHKDINEKRWRPKDTNPDVLEWCKYYTNMLERKNKMILTIWPEHCIVGSRGHAVVPVMNEALQMWAAQSGRPVNYIMKGQNCRTEMYSAIEAEVEDPKDGSTGLNSELIDTLKISDQLIVCGEAMSHCVNYTVRDIVKHWHGDLSKIILLKNGASPVSSFEKEAEKFVAWCAENKLSISTCEDVFNGVIAK